MIHSSNLLVAFGISAALISSVVLAEEQESGAITITGDAKYFTVGSLSYRGMASSRHRTRDLQFPIHFNSFPQGHKNARVLFTLRDAEGKAVSELDTKFPLAGDSTDTWVSMPFPSKQAGKYTLEAMLVIPRTGDSPAIRETRTTSFDVVSPARGQAVFDDDGTLLFNGTPYFPIGVRGVASEVNKMLGYSGYNAQFFDAGGVGDDGYGSPLGLDRAVGYGRKCFFDLPVSDRATSQDLIDAYKTHPAVAFWHVDGNADDAEWLRSADSSHPIYGEVDGIDGFLARKPRTDVTGFQCEATLSAALALGKRLETEVLPHHPAICVLRVGNGNVDEARAAAYAALVHNVRGIVLEGDGKIDMTTMNKSGFPELADELVTMRRALASANRRTFVDGDLHGIVCGTDNNNRFLILVNTSDKKLRTSFEVPELLNVANVTVPFYKPGDDNGADEPLVISDEDIEAPLISEDEMGMDVPTLDKDLLVVSDKKLAALASAKKRVKSDHEDVDARKKLQEAMQAISDSKANGGDDPSEEEQIKTLQLFCGRVQNTFKPHGTLVYRW